MEEIGRLGVASKDMGSAAQVVVDDGKRVQLAAQSSGFMRGVSGSCGLALPNNEENVVSHNFLTQVLNFVVIYKQFWWTKLQPL